MKKTAFSNIHEQLGAKMVDFAGYYMPVQYSGVIDEHLNVRHNVGIFDVSHMGEFILEGPDALKLIQKITTNDASKLIPGKVQYSCMTNLNGGIVDDLLVYCLDEENYMLVVNASNIEKDWEWIAQNDEWNVSKKNISEQTSLLAVQGPKSADALQPLTDIDLKSIQYYTFKKGSFAGIDNVLISATGYTGAGGFEIYFDTPHSEHVWNAIMEAGKEFGIKPAGLAARDTLRLEMGFCLYGNDIDDTTSPLEAGLGWITKFSKDFNAKEILEAQKSEGVQRKLVGFELTDKGIPRKDYEIVNEEGEKIGKVTSGTMSPSLKKAIGMGYVSAEYSTPGTPVYINVRNKKLKAQVVKTPFIQQ